ncbi:hypothetical protein DOTSEDRAFT_58735 [Dothistroma septosporum NZE10]|uniref:SUZ domain-containing protein n=1 Tax=Dothistroma septosporum (strain NZE10 / CBS 128990) TaxID=675120 RepID=N1Q2Q3_DOTSN|nr:hypothetical protein DOTSEDRAFT_58735 [Dothistroma septosporum NZE10]
MSKAGVPDAWDDDWTNVADVQSATDKAEPPVRLTKTEKRAQHAQLQRQLWDTAENPGRNLWLEAQGAVPLQQAPKPQVTLLSRKPPTIAKKDAADGVAGLSLDDGDDSEDEVRKKREADFEERQRKAKIEREEKQKRYAEARERIMGSGSASPAANSREGSQGRDSRRTRGNKTNGARRSQPDSPADRSPSRGGSKDPGLFDPDDMSRRLAGKRDANPLPREDQPLRQPRGPDNSGRGGCGFGGRGG